MTVHVLFCSDPDHPSRKRQLGWHTELGTCELPDDAPLAVVDDATNGYRCEACTNATRELTVDETTPSAPTLEERVAALEAAVTLEATTTTVDPASTVRP